MDKSENKNNSKKKKSIVPDCIFAAVLILLPFLHLAFGVEFTDTVYSPGNYENLQSMNLTWTIATFWANMLGKAFTLLPLGHTLIGMKFYTTLIPVAGVLTSYFYLKKYIPRVIVFLGEILAISLFWCPTTIIYNYLTYLLFTLATIVLIESLIKDKRFGLVAAGIILAFNVFVRFPNITEVALIAAVWFAAKKNKKKFIGGFIDTLICVVGFIAGLFINVAIIGAMYGFSSIPGMITSLFSMTGNNTGYKPLQMVLSMFRVYAQFTKSFILLIGITVLCFAVSAIMKKHFARIITIVAQFILYGGFLFWGYRNHVFTLNFTDYPSVVFWMVVFFVIGHILSIWALLRKRTSTEHKLMALAVLIILWITPLGSNNALFPSMNNLFITAPVIIFLCWHEMFEGRNFFELLDLEARNTMVASRIMIALLIVCIYVSGLIFGFVFIFRDPGFPYANSVEIKNNEVLVGMHTNPQRAALIAELNGYVKRRGLTGQKAIFYGNIPGFEYIFKMPCAISHSWPDLGSFSDADFKKDIDSLTEKPVIFINEDYCKDIFDLTNEATNKELFLADYMVNNDYKLKIRIGNIAIYGVY
ncbi:MAG: hypothetical protein J5840_02340 [Lachnospiraceae bacterium]|nr:hypothetical protein [Lachnospiraceae bacterium]